MHEALLVEPLDTIAGPFWDAIRDHIARKSVEIRRQRFCGAAMLPTGELEYTGITEKLASRDKLFRVWSGVVRTDAAA